MYILIIFALFPPPPPIEPFFFLTGSPSTSDYWLKVQWIKRNSNMFKLSFDKQTRLKLTLVHGKQLSTSAPRPSAIPLQQQASYWGQVFVPWVISLQKNVFVPYRHIYITVSHRWTRISATFQRRCLGLSNCTGIWEDSESITAMECGVDRKWGLWMDSPIRKILREHQKFMKKRGIKQISQHELFILTEIIKKHVIVYDSHLPRVIKIAFILRSTNKEQINRHSLFRQTGPTQQGASSEKSLWKILGMDWLLGGIALMCCVWVFCTNVCVRVHMLCVL